jgi:hypothetical protein
MKRKIFTSLLCAALLAITTTVSAGFNLGGIKVNLPDVKGGKQPAAPTTQNRETRDPGGLNHTPKKIEVTMDSKEGYDERSNYVIKGKVYYEGSTKSPPEYTDVLLAPASAQLKGNIFESGYYGKGYVNSNGDFEVGAKPGTYVIFIYAGSYACIATATAETDGESQVYYLKDTGARIQFRQ